jgi:hypothetical protein
MFHIPRKGKQLYTTRVYIERDSASRVNVVVITHLQKQQKKPKKEGEKKIVFLISKPNQNSAVTDVREE